MARSKTFIGIMWASVQRFGTMIVSFISNLILARLLMPKDFGLVGMLLFFISISQVFIDSGFGSALIQKKGTTNKDYSTIFILNIIISLFLYLVLFLIAPLVAKFYNIEILSSMLRIQGLVLIGNALCVIQTAILRKQMIFKRLAIANLIGNTLGSVVAIIAAFSGMGVWSLVIRTLCVSFITSVLLWIINDWRPIAYFSKKIVKELFSFGGYMLLSSCLMTISSNLQTLIIGKQFHQRILGLYTQALSLRNVASDSLQAVIGQVLFPDFSSLDDDSQIANKLNKGFYLISFFATAIMILLYIIGDPLVLFLYTSKWLPCVPYLQLLCIGGIFRALQDVNYYVIASKGRSKYLSIINLIKIPIFIIALVICAIYFGIYGVLWCLILNSTVSYLIYAQVATKILHTSIVGQLKSIAKSLGFSIISGCCLFIVTLYYHPSLLWLKLIVYTLVYLLCLIAIAYIFKAYPLKYIISIVKK